jgi:GTP cyclohydrolase I
MITHSQQLNLIKLLIESVGDSSSRAGLLETPERVVKSWSALFSGYDKHPQDVFKSFEEVCDELVIIKNIEFYSTCEHHMLPFYGRAHIAYIPNPEVGVIGASKLPRLLEVFSRRLQIQERIGRQVTDALDEYAKSLGSACIIEARHLCMCARGVEKQNSTMTTSSLTGVFKTKPEARMELLHLISLGNNTTTI